MEKFANMQIYEGIMQFLHGRVIGRPVSSRKKFRNLPEWIRKSSG